MATDTILTISMITNAALAVLENELTFTNKVLRTYDDSFGIDGAKIGDTLNVRRPPRFIGTSGPNLNVEDYNQTSIPVIVGNPGSTGGTTNQYGDQFHVDVSFTTKDLRLSLGAFTENVTKPAVAAVANRVDFIGLQMAKNFVGNIVGVPGTPPTSLLTYLTADAFLTAEATPKGRDRAVCIEQFTSASIVDALKGLFMPEKELSDQYRRGRMGRDSAGMDWYVDQNVNNQTFGSWGGATAGTLTANTLSGFGIATGWAQTSTVTLTQSATLTLNQGDVISFANVFPVNPQNRQVYGTKTRTFTVQSTVTGSGAGTMSVTVSPAIITSGQFQNVSVLATSTTAIVTPYNVGVNGVGQVSPQNILFHKNAFTCAMVDLPLPGGVMMAARASSKEAGMSIRVVQQYTINNDQAPARYDVLFGWAPLYQELGCKVAA